MHMKFIVAATTLVLATACAKAPEAGNAANSTKALTANASVNSANIPPEFSNSAPAANLPANGAVKGTGPMSKPKTFEFSEKDGPAPDDSEIKTALGENLVQTRTFHSHPQIAKVEKTTILGSGEARTTIKVYLKNGQVKEIRLANALTAPAADILKAIR